MSHGKKTAAQAVLLIGSGTAVVEGIRSLKAASVAGQYITLSNNASAGFVKLLGDAGHGVVVSQVMPASQSYALVKEAILLAKAQGMDDDQVNFWKEKFLGIPKPKGQ